jgi:hypothetical protein
MWAHGGNPKVGVPVPYGSPDPLLTPFPLLLLLNIVLCALLLSARIPALSWPTSSMTITAQGPRQPPRTISEGHNASLARTRVSGRFVCLACHDCLAPPASLLVSALPVEPLLSRKTRRISSKTRRLTPLTDTPNSKPRLAYPHRVTWSIPLVSRSIAPSFPLTRVSHVNTTLQYRLRRDPYSHPRTISLSPSSQSLSSRFSHPNSVAVFASESDSASDFDSDSDSDSDFSLTSDDHSESLSSASDVDSSSLFPRQTLSLDPSPFASLDLPPVLSPVYKVSYDIQGLPVTVPLPFSASPLSCPSLCLTAPLCLRVGYLTPLEIRVSG